VTTFRFHLGLDGQRDVRATTLQEAVLDLFGDQHLWYDDPAVPGRWYRPWLSITVGGKAVDDSVLTDQPDFSKKAMGGPTPRR